VAKRNLLLVDADPRSLRVLEVSLRKAGYSVTTAGSVGAALELIELAEPDMIISDTRLPGQDGFALVAELRARKSFEHIPLIFLSSDPSVEAKVRGLELGVEDYLTKPVYIREILARVSLTMERRDREGLGRTTKTRFAGSLQDMGLVDLLQTIEVSRKSGVLKLSSGQRRGSIYFREGRVLDAEIGKLQGEPAIYRFLLWSEGSFELEFGEVEREDKLDISTQALLMEGVRRLDEWGRLQEQLPALDTVLDVNDTELVARIGDIPDELNAILRTFDGLRDLSDVLELAEGDDLVVLTGVSRLFFDGFLTVRHRSELSTDAQVGRHSDPFLGYVPVESSVPAASLPSLRSPVPGAALPLSDYPDESARLSMLTPRASVADPAAASTGRTPVAVVQLKRVSAINELTPMRPSGVTREIGPEQANGDDDRDARASSRPTQALEGEDDMKQRGKRKSERADDRGRGTVIPLHQGRHEPARDDPGASREQPAGAGASAELKSAASTPAAEPSELASSGEQISERPTIELHHDDDHPDVRDFFAAASKSIPPSADHWGDLDVEPDPVHHYAHRRGMLWTLAIAGAGLFLIGAFLLYNKVIMPTPEELGRHGSVALPTPDMLRTPPPEDRATQPVAPEQPAPTQETAEPVDSTPVAPSAEPTVPSAEAPEGPPPQAISATPSPGLTPAPGVLAPSAPAASPPAGDSYAAALSDARKLGFRRSAEQRYLAAIALDPNGVEALSGLAMLYLNQGKNEPARVRAQQAVALDPKSAEGWIVLGAAQSALGRTKEARDAYARCAAIPGRYAAECRRLL
jgi:DNA-binding response OmpR family regulator